MRRYRKYPRRVLRKRRALRKRKTNVPDKASCSVSFNVANVTTNIAYNYETFRLTDSARAVAIAEGYQQYRIVNIRTVFKPTYDTYAPGVATTKPVLYAMVDKSRSIQDTFTIAQLKEMGCRPRRLDEKPLVCQWKPGVLMDADRIVASAPASVRYAPWLTTNGNASVPGANWIPDTTTHQGLKFYIESADGGSAVPIQVTVEYQIEFKKPNWAGSSSSVKALGMTLP